MRLRLALVLLAFLSILGPAQAQRGPQQVDATGIPPGTAITAVGTGTTGAVTATLAAATNRTTYICGFNVSAAGSGAVSPITVTGLVGGTFTYQNVTAGSNFLAPVYNPCIPASAPNTAIVITTTADGTATAVNVMAWGFQF